MPAKPPNRKPYVEPDPSDPTYNAFKHLLLLSERYPLLRYLASRYEAEIDPQGGVEDFLVYDLVANSWRMWRLQMMEVAMLNHQMKTQPNDNQFPGGYSFTALRNADSFSGMARLIARLESAARRAFHSTLKVLLDYRAKLARFHKQAKRDIQEPPLPTMPPETQPETEKESTPCCPQPA